MRVIQAYPEVALRMSGALGPLQSEPVTGILTIALSEVDGGTRVVFEYNVGGQMRYPEEVISTAVDGVMTLQLSRLADLLGVIEAPAVPSAAEPEAEPGTEAESEEAAAGDEAEGGEDVDPITIEPEDVIEAEDEGPSVDEAFGDLSDG